MLDHKTRSKTLVTSICMLLMSQAAEAANLTLLRQIHDARQNYEKKQYDSPAPDFEGYRKVTKMEKRAFVLLAPMRRQASAVFESPSIKNNFDLSSFVADDTIHVTEGDFTTIKCQPNQKIAVQMAWDRVMLQRYDVYMGEPGEMHNSGYKSVRKLKIENG